MNKIAEIKGFQNYLIFDDGRVFSKHSSKFLAGGFDRDGYRQVQLCYGGSKHTKKVHRLVAEAFLENPNNLPVVNHMDHVKSNNSYENLEWCSVSYNTKEAYKYGKLTQKGERNNACKYSDEDVRRVVALYETIKNISEISRQTNIKYGTVYSFIKGLRRA